MKNILLSKKAWDEFSYKMVHPKNPCLIDIFFSTMSPISIQYEDKDVIIESNNINEEEIFKVLLNN